MAKIISFANQKGGAGKSTTTTFFANGLHSLGFKVAVIDADYQKSLINIRELNVNQNPDIDENTLYPILYSTPNKIRDILEDEEDNFDYIFVDVPGNITADSLVGIYGGVDLIVVVHDANLIGVMSTIEFLEKVETEIVERLAKTNYKCPKIMNILSKYEEHKVIHKNFINSKEQLTHYPFFSKQIRKLEALNTINTITPYTNSKYNYEFDMLYKELINVLN